MTTVLECLHLKKEYKKGNNSIIVFKDLNYKFRKGKVYAIVGKSEAGKTTLINMLGLLAKATDGEIIINNKSAIFII